MKSSVFTISNGVQQGGILTPKLFSDDMLRQMQTLYTRSNRLLKIFPDCGENVLIKFGSSFCGSFTICGHQYSLSKLRVA